jgi:lysozyme
MKLDSNPRYPTRWFDEPPQAVELAKRFEGFHRVQRGDPGRAHPYTCRGATGPSDTVGSAIANTQRSSIIEAEEEACLGEDLRTALDGTLRFCPILAAETEARLVAIVDFTFNLGAGRLQTSTPRQRVNGSTRGTGSQPRRRSSAGSMGAAKSSLGSWRGARRRQSCSKVDSNRGCADDDIAPTIGISNDWDLDRQFHPPPPPPATCTSRTRDEAPVRALFLFVSKGFNEAIRLSETGVSARIGL